jgi:hypothetical protein
MNHPTSPFDKGGSRGILDTDAASALPPPANFLAAANNLPSPGGRGTDYRPPWTSPFGKRGLRGLQDTNAASPFLRVREEARLSAGCPLLAAGWRGHALPRDHEPSNLPLWQRGIEGDLGKVNARPRGTSGDSPKNRIGTNRQLHVGADGLEVKLNG